MSLCFMRSTSPIHVQYLKNMGVCATLVVSILVGGRLWGLVPCHHYEPRAVHFDLRSVCELLAEAVGTRIAALESFAQSQAELAVRRMEQRMVEGITRHGDWRAALFDPSHSILKPVNATGAALMDGQVLTVGEVPATEVLRRLGRWLDAKGLQETGSAGMFATCSLALDEPEFASIVGVAAGLLAIPVSNLRGDYLIWLRPEQVRTVTWGGHPFKPVVVGNSPSDLSPRRSFSQWHRVVEGTSEPWSAPVLTTARLIGNTGSDVVIQFRSVGMLIAQAQLDLLRGQVERSAHAVVVAGDLGQIVTSSEAFEAMVPPSHPALTRLEDLAQLFEDPAAVLHRLRDLVGRRQPWRGEAQLIGSDGEARPVLVRADPVFSAPECVLGFVVAVTDLVERKVAEAARRRFQETIVMHSRLTAGLLDSKMDLLHKNLLSAVIENAQLAALEITDGVEVSQIPALLESVQSSVDRASLSPRLRRPAIDDATTALGALYVVVGASLGARVLVQQAAALSLPAEGGNAYLQALATSTDWPAFRELLESEPISSEARLGEGANAAFESILEALTATMPGLVSARP